MTRSDLTPVCESATGREPATGTGSAGDWFTARAQLALTACACGGASAFLFAVDPSRHAVYPPCLLYQTTGIYCAGCGATRALYALLHGNVVGALHDNVLFVGALPFLAWMALPRLAQVWRENRWPEMKLEGWNVARTTFWVMALAIVFMVLRNLPGWPFELLRPI